MMVIPAVDIKGGKCVRLRQGRPEDVTVFGDDPVAMAQRWEQEGASYLHVVDLDGAFEGESRNLDIIKRIVRTLKIKVEVGGGLRTDEAVDELLNEGADRVVLGTRVVESVSWLTQFTCKFPDRIAVGIDVRDGLLTTHGMLQTSGVTPIELVRLIGDAPLAAYIYTDVLRDGTNTGPNIAAIRRFAHATRIPVIGSGGVSSLDDVRELAALGIFGVVIGRALYDGRFTLKDAQKAAGEAPAKGT